jgi:hypothetical protein
MFLGTAFWISFVLSVLKGLEIVLSQSQQKKVQDSLETMALRLSYVTLSTLYEKLKQFRVQMVLALITLAFGILSDWLAQDLNFWNWIRLQESNSFVLLIFQAVLILTIFPLGMRWLVRGNSSSFLKKVGFILGTAIIGILVAVVFDVDIFLDNYPHWRLFVVVPVAVVLGVCSYASVYFLIIKFAQAFLWLLTRIVLRIVEYPKGAWAGLLFVITAILGIVEALISKKH